MLRGARPKHLVASIALVLAVATYLTPAESASGSKPITAPIPIPGTNPATALAAFHQALSELENGLRKRVTVVQIGDSHTEGDRFSGALRILLQHRFGNAGRGMLPPGMPFSDWLPLGLKVEQHGDWRVSSSNKTKFDPIPYGVSGFAIHSTKAGNSFSLEAEDGGEFDWVDIGFYRQPAGGRLEVRADGEVIGEVDTSGPGYELTHQRLNAPKRARTLVVRAAGDQPVDVANWSIYRNEPGVVLTSHGFSGAQIGIMERWDWPTVTKELRALDPALVLVAFGTNEGYAPLGRLENYAEIYENRLRALQRALPRASIVAIGAPDANDLPKYCKVDRSHTPCRELDEDETAHYDELMRKEDTRLCRWHTPAHIAYVRDLQRRITAKLGILFWDWASVEGGTCGASRWAEKGLVYPDRVHLKKDGAAMSADQLYSVLMQGYDGS